MTLGMDSSSPAVGCARLYYPDFMGRPFEKVTLADAVGRLRPGMKVLLAPGCGDPSALVHEILRQADRLAPLTLMGGLRLDDYPFGSPAYAGKIRFATWHMSPRLAAAAARGDVDFVPARYFDTVSLFTAGGPWAPDAVLVHTAPPDRGGHLSLGVSVSYLLPAARRAPLVIPGQPSNAPHAGQRLPPPLAGRRVDPGRSSAARVPAHPGRRGGAADRRVCGRARPGRGDAPGRGGLDSAGGDGGARGQERPGRALTPGRVHAAAGAE